MSKLRRPTKLLLVCAAMTLLTACNSADTRETMDDAAEDVRQMVEQLPRELDRAMDADVRRTIDDLGDQIQELVDRVGEEIRQRS